MAEHRKTTFTATVTWLGRVPDAPENIRSAPAGGITLTYAGVDGEHHSGLTRPACVRVKNRHEKGTEIANTRQLSILSAEELAQIADAIGLDTLDPALLGASLVLEGIPDFTLVPPGSRLQAQDGTTLVIDVENGPCNWPAREIEKDAPGHGKPFKAAARGRRGVTAWVERPGTLAIGDTLALHIPDQPAWPHADAARA